MTAASPTRSYLYVPGNAQDKLVKALTRRADALILDLEDAVPLVQKDVTRAGIVEWLRQQPADGAVALWVRVNAGSLRELDVSSLAGIPALTGLVLAKIEDAAEVARIDEMLTDAGDTESLLMPLVETASAVLDARDIARQKRVHVLQIGEADLAGDMGLEPGPDEAELAGARTMVILASAAAGLEAPMGPVSAITRDLDAFRVSTERVRRQGFLGRACIHPAQVQIVHEVFTPTAGQVARARDVLDLIRRAEAAGSGVTLDADGRMIDPAVTRAANRVLALAERSAG